MFTELVQDDACWNAADKPVAVFTTPSTSLQIFKRSASDSKNMITVPDYCTPNAIGARINGNKTIEFENKQIVEVKLEVSACRCKRHHAYGTKLSAEACRAWRSGKDEIFNRENNYYVFSRQHPS